ncbi:TIGR03758 family integrating conjugative element protein, partial [Salmonella enterica]
MSPEQISAFQAASLVKPDAVSLVMLGLFSAFLLLWVVWVLNDAYRGVATARV